jgi:hypothetical protein
MAAEPEEIPAGPLRDIAYRVSADTRAVMSVLELRLRCEWVWELECRALNEEPEKAQRTRRLAEKALKSLSDYSYSQAQMELSEALADAQRRQDAQGAALALQNLNALEHRHPRVPADRVIGHAAEVVVKAAESRLSIPSSPKSRLFFRNRGR